MSFIFLQESSPEQRIGEALENQEQIAGVLRGE